MGCLPRGARKEVNRGLGEVLAMFPGEGRERVLGAVAALVLASFELCEVDCPDGDLAADSADEERGGCHA